MAATEVGKLVLDHAGKLRARKVDQKVVNDMVCMLIIEHDLSFSFAEYRRFRELVKYLCPDAKIPSRRACSIYINNMYEEQKNKLKVVLSKIPSRISLTSDLWTSCTTKGYISLTAHYVDENWKLNSKILNFYHLPPPYSGAEMAKTIYEFLEDWGIERKFFSLTLDNASSNDTHSRLLKDRLLTNNTGLLCGGEFFHIWCCAHILNLIVQDGLKVAKNALLKIRESVKYVKGSEGKMIVFKACVAKVGGVDTKIGLRLDLVTRWNSTYLMLESALAYRRAFNTLAFEDANYVICPTAEEWLRAENICEFFKPFYVITELMSGSSYPTSNLYFSQVWQIECWLVKDSSHEDVAIREMIFRMKEKFDKYWSEYSDVLALGTILDPRYKMSFLRFCYTKLGLDSTSVQAKLQVLKHKLQSLFQEYVKMSKKEATTRMQQEPQLSLGKEKSISTQQEFVDEFLQFENDNISNDGNSELDIYLEEQKLSLAYHPNLDILNYWKENQVRFPDLSLLACDILSIQITIVASESAFSMGSRVLNKYRIRLLPDNVQSYLCIKNWLLGFEIEDEVSKSMEISNKEEPTMSKMGSNIFDEEE